MRPVHLYWNKHGPSPPTVGPFNTSSCEAEGDQKKVCRQAPHVHTGHSCLTGTRRQQSRPGNPKQSTTQRAVSQGYDLSSETVANQSLRHMTACSWLWVPFSVVIQVLPVHERDYAAAVPQVKPTILRRRWTRSMILHTTSDSHVWNWAKRLGAQGES
mmetsp:Transcript_26364/g.54773  ORF Transcript_26364/g.54773 Transcript_26364/m.54773 type:complete len:158 (-) Transcript_26364:29-502(-)